MANTAKKKSKKKYSNKKLEFFYFIDENISHQRIFVKDEQRLIEDLQMCTFCYLAAGDEVEIKVGKDKMTQKQFDNLPEVTD